MSNLPQEDYDYAEVIGRNLQRLTNKRATPQAAIAQKSGIRRMGNGTRVTILRTTSTN